MTEYERDGLKNKPVRFWIRDEIESIIKEKNIDRTRFHEYSKTKYDKVIKGFYYGFLDYVNHPYKTQNALSYCWLHFRKELNEVEVIRESQNGWNYFLKDLETVLPVPEDTSFYFIVPEGWVYEGYIHEILSVLNETDGLLQDFYFVSQKFDWCIAYCDEGDCAVLYQK